jgi:VanZ family protein
VLRRPRTLLALSAVAAVYGLVIWPMESPEEKLHFLEYGVVALLASAGSPVAWSRSRRFIGAALFTLAAGWLDEGIQALLPTRYYDLRDVGFNALAGVMALAALEVVRFVSRRPSGA